jgi:hypothetical protein
MGEQDLLTRAGATSTRAGPGDRADADPSHPGLSARNEEHLRFVASSARALPAACGELAERRARSGRDRDRDAILLNRIACELFTMSVTLARAGDLASGHGEVQDLADVFCAAARHRLADWWGLLRDDAEPDHARAAGAWLGEGRPALTLRDVLTDVPPA